jgi:MauM/NapG family ferredoxin protein
MGTSIDLLEKAFLKKTKSKGLKEERQWKTVKYYILIVTLASALLGLSVVYFLDPIAFLTRVCALVFFPIFIKVANFLLDCIRPLAEALGWVGLARTSYQQPVFTMGLVTLFLFSVIVYLGVFVSRFWCRSLCPLGALLSLLSRFGIYKRRVAKTCNECGICEKNCSMGAIGKDPRETVVGECIQCLKCKELCPQEAIAFTADFSPKGAAVVPEINLSRRGCLYALGGGVALGLSLDTAPFTKLREGFLIRPPGAIPEKEFLRTCVRCGQCMKACPTNTLQPSFWEAGLEGLWTPKIAPRLAQCEQSCNLCGRVCPTQAIRNLTLEEKKYAKVGTAALDRQRCLVWEQDKLCLICDEACPYNAIVFKVVEGFRRPFIQENKCNGCGVCETKCPVVGESAIRVYSDGEIRLKTGSYTEIGEKLELDLQEDPGYDRFLVDLRDGEPTTPVGEEAAEEKEGGSALPPGFTF